MELFLNLSAENIDINADKYIPLIENTIRAILTAENISDDCEVSVMFTDNPTIRKLNRRYREKDSATDVLSFPVSESLDVFNPDSGAVLLGDIVISLEWAEADASEFGVTTEDMIAFLTAHSALHLLGYDHEISEEAAEEMFAKQRAAMEKLGMPCPY